MGEFTTVYLTNRFHLAVRVYSDNTQMALKRVQNKEIRCKPQESSVNDVLITFWLSLCVIRIHTQGQIVLFVLYVVLISIILKIKLEIFFKIFVVMIFARRTLRLITSIMRLYFKHRLSLTNQNSCVIKDLNIYQLISKRLIRIKKAFRGVAMKQRTLNNFTIVPPSWAKELPSSPYFNYPLHDMWHIRPQHFPANQLCWPLWCVPHSSASTQLFFLSLCRPSLCCLGSASLSSPFQASG